MQKLAQLGSLKSDWSIPFSSFAYLELVIFPFGFRIYSIADGTYWIDLEKNTETNEWMWLSSNESISASNFTNWAAG